MLQQDMQERGGNLQYVDQNNRNMCKNNEHLGHSHSCHTTALRSAYATLMRVIELALFSSFTPQLAVITAINLRIPELVKCKLSGGGKSRQRYKLDGGTYRLASTFLQGYHELFSEVIGES